MKKAFGQNLLVNKIYLKKIIEKLDLNKEDTVIEIGSGTGLLTFEIAKYVKKVYAIEFEREILKTLKENINKSTFKNIELIEIDFLKLDLNIFKEKFTIVGNIPYNISTKIISKIFGDYNSPSNFLTNIKNIFFMVQKEYAQRISAKVNTKNYSPLTIFVNYFSSPNILFYVEKESFFPKPKVDSAFIELKPKEQLLKIGNTEKFKKIIKTAFSQKRKKIINSLETIFNSKDELSRILKDANINKDLRAENLSIEDFLTLNERVYVQPSISHHI